MQTAGLARNVDYLGDSLANGGEYNRRHNAVNAAFCDAIRAVAIGPIVLGDKGDALATVHLNSTHVIDAAELGGDDNTGGDCLYETKCINALKFNPRGAGNGNQRYGGAPAPMGHRTAFGNTAESTRCLVFGCAERGTQAQGQLRHDTGLGWVAPRAGQYADALSRKTKVCLVLVESLGGIYRDTKFALHALSKRAAAATALDRTRYGVAAASPRTFMQHHSQRIARAAVLQDAAAIRKKIIALKREATLSLRADAISNAPDPQLTHTY